MKPVPFFARFLKTQENPVRTGIKAGGNYTLKYPSDKDEEAMTMKYPSDSDETRGSY